MTKAWPKLLSYAACAARSAVLAASGAAWCGSADDSSASAPVRSVRERS